MKWKIIEINLNRCKLPLFDINVTNDKKIFIEKIVQLKAG